MNLNLERKKKSKLVISVQFYYYDSFSSLWTDSAWGNPNWNSTVGINTYWHWLLLHVNFFFCQLSLMCFDQLTENGHIYCTVCSLQQQQCLSLGSQRTLTGRSQQDTNQVKSFTFDLLFNLMGLWKGLFHTSAIKQWVDPNYGVF